MTASTLRLDKWLWYARLFKSRTLAAKVCQSGRMRVNGTLIGKSKQLVNPGDVLTFPKGPYIRVIKVLLLGERRGPAAEAQTLYEDLDPPKPVTEETLIRNADVRTAPVGKRDRGSGRPTKTERRAFDRLRGEVDEGDEVD